MIIETKPEKVKACEKGRCSNTEEFNEYYEIKSILHGTTFSDSGVEDSVIKIDARYNFCPICGEKIKEEAKNDCDSKL